MNEDRGRDNCQLCVEQWAGQGSIFYPCSEHAGQMLRATRLGLGWKRRRAGLTVSCLCHVETKGPLLAIYPCAACAAWVRVGPRHDHGLVPHAAAAVNWVRGHAEGDGTQTLVGQRCGCVYCGQGSLTGIVACARHGCRAEPEASTGDRRRHLCTTLMTSATSAGQTTGCVACGCTIGFPGGGQAPPVQSSCPEHLSPSATIQPILPPQALK